MTMWRAVSFGAVVLLLGTFVGSSAAADPPLVGTYQVQGTTHDGKKYGGFNAVITHKKGGGYHLDWGNGKADGVWVLDRLILVDAKAVQAYKLESDGRLIGS